MGFGEFAVRSFELNKLPFQQASHKMSVKRNGTDHQRHQHTNVELIVAKSGDRNIRVVGRVQFYPPD